MGIHGVHGSIGFMLTPSSQAEFLLFDHQKTSQKQSSTHVLDDGDALKWREFKFRQIKPIVRIFIIMDCCQDVQMC